ncbi:phytanoyl-CoA dioxygenase family protein [Limibaculum sp. M0105]|uniref:Phytanoyl-CoA dioxygenase family protein n=1 Tax=Thermohalobaculum xanthum TaxID=2753746 RepID=A0A8J7M7H7_9RHOB|nr:phytanoyl-CoA dioxygenase family protein [Thermohalobaculum xanthum]MBK0399307.1 phytanoyl-CoA dioxygenase family protein [Thermohalobaculum xanthum]
MPALAETQVAAYRRDGFLCPVDVFTPAEAQQLRAELEAHEALHPSRGLKRDIAQYQRVNAHVVMETARRVAAERRILDAVESLLGPDLMVWSCEYFIKEPHTTKVVSWHQDLTYWGMDGSDHEVTAWIALSPATEASGCMRFVPGSHGQALVPHRDTFAEDNLLSRGQEIAVEVDEADAVVAALNPGQMSLHHGRLFHASGPNVTDDRRIGLVVRYIRPDTPSTGVGRDYAMLVRGCDRTLGRINMVPPSGDFSPAAIALYEEILAAQSATLSDGAEGGVSLYAEA